MKTIKPDVMQYFLDNVYVYFIDKGNWQVITAFNTPDYRKMHLHQHIDIIDSKGEAFIGAYGRRYRAYMRVTRIKTLEEFQKKLAEVQGVQKEG